MQHADAISDNRASYAHALNLVALKGGVSLPVGMRQLISRQQIDFGT